MTGIATPARRGLSARVHDFFYAEETPYGLAVVRMCLPLVLLLVVVPRWPHARELFSSDGAPTPLWISYGMERGLPIPDGPVAVALFSALLFFLLTAAAGWMTRLSLLASMLLFTYFGLLDMVSTLTKYTCVAAHAMLLLSLSECGSVWSVDAWMRSVRKPEAASPPRSAAWPRRLIQLLIGVIYLASAVTKFHTPSFFSGDQLVFWMLTDSNYANPLGDFLSMYPALAPLTAYATIFWEIGFVFAAWRGCGRVMMLSLGVVFHVMTWGVLGLLIFPLVYLALYPSFLNEVDVERVRGRLRRRRDLTVADTAMPGRGRRVVGWFGPAQSAAAFSLLVAATAVAGVEIEHRSDPFGLRRAEGRFALRPIAAERVTQLLSQNTTVAPEDKLLDFDVGTVTLGGIVADAQDAFEYGDKAIVQCSLLPPHEDMWVEFNLHDDDGRIVARHGQVVAREFLRSSYVYKFGEDLPVGAYQWVLRFDGREVARKPFTLGALRTASATSSAAATR